MPLRTATATDEAALEEAIAADEQDALDAERQAQATDWRTVPPDQVPPWRRADREWLDAAPAADGGLADELHGLARLHQAGDLSDREFAAAKARLLGTD